NRAADHPRDQCIGQRESRVRRQGPDYRNGTDARDSAAPAVAAASRAGGQTARNVSATQPRSDRPVPAAPPSAGRDGAKLSAGSRLGRPDQKSRAPAADVVRREGTLSWWSNATTLAFVRRADRVCIPVSGGAAQIGL